MTQTSFASNIYHSGKVVNVDEALLRRTFVAIENELGFDHREYPFQLFLNHKGEGKDDIRSGGWSNFVQGAIGLCPQTHEGIVLHEATHHVLGKRGLHLNPKVDSWAFYDHLISETLVEGLAAKVYGYKKTPLMVSYVSLRKLYNEDQTKFQSIVDAGAESDSFINQVTCMAALHKALEWHYKVNPQDEEVLKTIKYFDSISKRSAGKEWYSHDKRVITVLSEWNAFDLLFQRTPITGIIRELEKGIVDKTNSRDFYFNNIASKLPSFNPDGSVI